MSQIKIAKCDICKRTDQDYKGMTLFGYEVDTGLSVEIYLSLNLWEYDAHICSDCIIAFRDNFNRGSYQ